MLEEEIQGLLEGWMSLAACHTQPVRGMRGEVEPGPWMARRQPPWKTVLCDGRILVPAAIVPLDSKKITESLARHGGVQHPQLVQPVQRGKRAVNGAQLTLHQAARKADILIAESRERLDDGRIWCDALENLPDAGYFEVRSVLFDESDGYGAVRDRLDLECCL
jgi:hypothetical protein